MNITNRKIMSGNKEVEDLFNAAAQSGHDVIELIWKKFRPSVAKHWGFEVPTVSDKSVSASNTLEVNLATDVKVECGYTLFYPDENNRCWGYIIDTPINRYKLARSIKTGWFLIVDPKIREEVTKMAADKGWPTEALEKPKYGEKVSNKEKQLTRKLEETQAKLSEYQLKIATLEKEKSKIVGERLEKEEKKPLAGIRIAKDTDKVLEGVPVAN
jgi:hypothetical protein